MSACCWPQWLGEFQTFVHLNTSWSEFDWLRPSAEHQTLEYLTTWLRFTWTDQGYHNVFIPVEMSHHFKENFCFIYSYHPFSFDCLIWTWKSSNQASKKQKGLACKRYSAQVVVLQEKMWNFDMKIRISVNTWGNITFFSVSGQFLCKPLYFELCWEPYKAQTCAQKPLLCDKYCWFFGALMAYRLK